MSTTTPNSPSLQADQPRSPGPKSAVRMLILGVVVVLGLIATNALSLLHERFHAYAFGVVSSAVKLLPSGDDLLTNSPTATRKREVEAATIELHSGISKLKDSVAVLTAINVAQGTENLMLRNQNATLLGDLAALRQQHATLSQKHTSNRNVAYNVSKRIATRSAINAGKNLAALPETSIPWVGIPFNIAMTTWDVKDACDTLKDLNEMNMEFEFNLAKADETKVCGMHVPTATEIKDRVKNWM
jgi:hypothetical protein